jgi:hypothetical protein
LRRTVAPVELSAGTRPRNDISWRGVVEAAHVADLGGKGHSHQERGAAHRLVGPDHRRHRPARDDHGQLLLQPVQALNLVVAILLIRAS